MNQHRRFMQVTLLVVLLAILGYCVAANDLVLFMIAVPGAIGAWWARTKPWAVHVPRILLNLALLVSVLLVASVTIRQGVTLERVAELMIVLTVIKCFDRKIARDYTELYTLALFLIIGAVMTSVRLELGLVLFVFMPAAVVGVMLLQIYAAHERVTLSMRAGAPRSNQRSTPRLARSEHSSSQFRLTAAFVLLGGSAVSIAVFVLVPRGMGENILGTNVGSTRGMKTAFTGNVRLGRPGLLTESTTPVLHMAVLDEFDQNLGSDSIVYYLRGNVLDKYNAETGSWVRDDSVPIRRSPPLPVEPNTWLRLAGNEGTTVRQIITLLAGNEESNYLFAVYRPTRIKFDRRVRIKQESDDRILVLNHSGELKYEVESAMRPTLRGDQQEIVSVTFASDIVQSLAESILDTSQIERDSKLRDNQGDRDAALAFRDYLHSEFTYTTDIQAPSADQDPIEWFLSDHREGHCEYFASAMAAMCRSVGIDARVVTGYVAVEWNELSSQYVVRESNAHAWVEVRDRRGEFRTYDPTPPDDLRAVHAPKQGLMAKLRSLLDSMEHLWVSRVVTFDSGMRDTLMRDRKGIDTTFADSARQLLSKTKLGGFSLAIQAVLVGTIVCALVVGVGALLRQLVGRRVRKKNGRNGRVAQEAFATEPWLDKTDFYHELLEALQSLGHPKPVSVPPLAHLEGIEGAQPQLANGALPLVNLYYRARFGHQPVSGDEQCSAVAILAQLKSNRDRDADTDSPPE